MMLAKCQLLSRYAMNFGSELAPLVLGVSFQLTHQRLGNVFSLVCSIQNGITDPSLLQFWINETDRTYLAREATRVTNHISLHGSYELLPMNEGTFFCGEGIIESNGLGPFTANPVRYAGNNVNTLKSNVTVTLGENTTLLCPITLGALLQSYNITWTATHTSNLSLPQYKTGVTDDMMPSLTISDVQRSNLGTYYCTVTVTNPYDGEMWSLSQGFLLHTNSFPNYELFGILAAGIPLLLLPIIITVIIILCIKSRKHKRNRKFQENDTSFLSLAQHVVVLPFLKDEHSQDDFNDLEIGSNIGNGVFGAVFKATYKGHPCAAKLLTHLAQEVMTGGIFPSTAGEIQPEVLKSFNKECDFLKKLKHENIVQHLATLTEPKSKLPVLVLELLDCNLKQYLESEHQMKTLTPSHMSICLDISRGLEYLHSETIVHRDICDVNILLAVKGDNDTPRAKVADFGMSRTLPLDYKLTGLSHREVYIPAEARTDPYRYGSSLDIYSFGVVAVQIVQVKTGLTAKSLHPVFKEIPKKHPLKKIICSCLSKNRKKRPKAADIVNMIEEPNLKSNSWCC